MSIVLCGFKNCGKTTLAKKFATATDWQMLDTDHVMLHLSKFNGSIGELYNALGEDDFRALEVEIVTSLQPQEKRIIATGGGTMMVAKSRKHLKDIGKIIYLNEPPAVLLKRMLNSDRLPSFIDSKNPEASFNIYYKERHKVYKKYADDIIIPSEQNDEANIKNLEKIGNNHV